MCLYSSPYRQNDYGQIGSGSNENVVVPRLVERVGRVSKVTCGANHNLALTGTDSALMRIFSFLKFQNAAVYYCCPHLHSLFLFNEFCHA